MPSAIVAALSAACFGACGSSEGGSPISVEDLPRLLADAVCNNIGPCCKQAGFPHDPVQCHAAAERELRGEIDQARTRANRAYDAVAARDCVDAYTLAVKACAEGREIDAVCKRVFVGTIQPGQTCATSNECAPGSTCARSGDGSAMLCLDSKELRGKLGQGCGSTCTEFEDGVSSCGGGGGQGGSGGSTQVNCYVNDGLYCDSASTCAPTLVIGQACVSSYLCAEGAFCDNGTCTAKRTSGSCGQANDSCAGTAYCDATQQCQLRKSTGAACVIDDECLTTDRCGGGTCRTRTIASADACLEGF